MKYIKTPDLWDPSTHDALTSGNLKLQVGQWVYCGDKQHPSRYIGVNLKSGTIYAAHPQGLNGKGVMGRFAIMRENCKDRIS